MTANCLYAGKQQSLDLTGPLCSLYVATGSFPHPSQMPLPGNGGDDHRKDIENHHGLPIHSTQFSLH